MPTEILSSYPKREIYIHLEPRFRPIFETAERLLTQYFDDPETLALPPDDFFIDELLTQARDYHAAGLGYLRDLGDADGSGDQRIAAESRRLALRAQSLALILADAADRANQASGREPNGQVRAKVDFIRAKAAETPANPAEVAELVRLFDEARRRGFRPPTSLQALVMIIGDEGCPDTANILRITNAYRLPVHFVVLNERHGDRSGFRRSNDHAQAYHEDAFLDENGQKAPPRIPHVTFPPLSGEMVELLEPTPFQFFAELAGREII